MYTTTKFRICKQTSKPQTNYRCCLRFSYLAPYWLISRNTITFHRYFWCSRFCEFHSNYLNGYLYYCISWLLCPVWQMWRTDWTFHKFNRRWVPLWLEEWSWVGGYGYESLEKRWEHLIRKRYDIPGLEIKKTRGCLLVTNWRNIVARCKFWSPVCIM